MATWQQTTVAATLTAGPFGALYVQQPESGGADTAGTAAVAAGLPATLAMGSYAGGTASPVNGLNFAGIAAVVSAISTYYSGLSAAKKAQVGLGGVHVTAAGFSVTVHNADVMSLASSLATVLNTAGNYGPAGS
jgi:hypothetical protein